MKIVLQAALSLALILAGSAAGAVQLNQAAFVPNTTTYKFGYRSIPSIPVVGAPRDTDYSRWAMLHDGTDYRLYFFKSGSADTIYQFAFDRRVEQYKFGYNSIRALRIVGAPQDADASSFSMLHDGAEYRLYLRRQGNPRILYQFAFNPETENYEYGYHSLPVIEVTGFPEDTDWSRWDMLHDGEYYRFYAFRAGSNDEFYQAAYNDRTQRYEFAYQSIPILTLVGTPANSDTASSAMLYDGKDYRFYFLAQ